jgi:hypothetical protein
LLQVFAKTLIVSHHLTIEIMPPEGYKPEDRISVLEARLKEIKAKQAITNAVDKFKKDNPNATFGEVMAFELGYKAALNNQ